MTKNKFIEFKGMDYRKVELHAPMNQLYRYKGETNLKNFFDGYRNVIIPSILEAKVGDEWERIHPIFMDPNNPYKDIHVISIDGHISTIYTGFMIKDEDYQKAVDLGLAKDMSENQ
ncbi:hypothetical protein KY321_03120 [Candidatus Woesearchaeota archaeon]|nr:hypothetical protein [Candidatus Woesearchaeota archaeon]